MAHRHTFWWWFRDWHVPGDTAQEEFKTGLRWFLGVAVLTLVLLVVAFLAYQGLQPVEGPPTGPQVPGR